MHCLFILCVCISLELDQADTVIDSLSDWRWLMSGREVCKSEKSKGLQLMIISITN